MCESLGRGIAQLMRTVLRPYRGAAAAVLLSLLTALVPGRSLAAPAPLLRIIHVAQIAVSLFYNAPAQQVLVIGAAPYVNSSSNGSPLAYTVLDGKTGAAIKRLDPTIAPLGFTTVQPSADGSGQLYLGTASGLCSRLKQTAGLVHRSCRQRRCTHPCLSRCPDGNLTCPRSAPSRDRWRWTTRDRSRCSGEAPGVVRRA